MKNSWLKYVCWLLAFCAIAILNSCEKEEKKIIVAPVQTQQIPEGKDYATEFFFQLAGNKTVSSNQRDDWDLAFESNSDGHHVYLNSAKFMFAYSSGKTNFDSTYSFNNSKLYTWVDQPSGNIDSTAIGEWGTSSGGTVTSLNNVYLIDRGKTIANAQLEKRKVLFQGMSNGTYTIRYANLDGTDEHVVQIPKASDHTFVYLSLDNGGQTVSVAPAINTWDLHFTMYTHVFDTTPPGIPIAVKNFPYILNGVLLNPATVSVSKDIMNDVPFDSVTLSMAQSSTYSKAWNAIGYDWKTFDFNDENYTIAANIKYFIKTTDGKYYKLRFTDFYDKNGVKGYPTFQYQLLQ